jgi:hypothetical protein
MTPTGAALSMTNRTYDLSGPGSIIAGAIEPPALTRKSCAPNAAAWTNDARVLTSTFAKAAAGQRTWSPLAIDNLLRHSLNTDTIGATVGRTALDSRRHQRNTATLGTGHHPVRPAKPSRAEETGTDEATKTTKGG